MTGRLIPDEVRNSSMRSPETRSWVLAGFFVAVLVCSVAVPVSAALRGVLRFGPVNVEPGRPGQNPLLVLWGPVHITGEHLAPVVVVGGSLLLDGSAGDDLIALAGDVSLGPNSAARGNVISLGGTIAQSPGATISGSIVGGRTPWSAAGVVPQAATVPYLLQRLRLAGLAVAALLLLGLGVWAVLPWPALVTTATARRCRIRSAFLGIGTLLWTPLIVAPLAVSLAGLPLAVLLMLGLGGLWLIGVVSTSVRLGHRILSLGGRPHSMLSATLAGLVCLGLLPALPVVGPVALMLAGSIGLGAALVALWDREAASELAVTQALAAFRFPE